MATRLGAKARKRRKDQHTAYAAGKAPKAHKVAVERSKKAKRKLYNNK